MFLENYVKLLKFGQKFNFKYYKRRRKDRLSEIFVLSAYTKDEAVIPARVAAIICKHLEEKAYCMIIRRRATPKIQQIEEIEEALIETPAPVEAEIIQSLKAETSDINETKQEPAAEQKMNLKCRPVKYRLMSP